MSRADHPGFPDLLQVEHPSRRIGRRIVGISLLAVVAIAAFLFWRATSIHSLPNIVDPFDRLKDGFIPIPDDENAFTFYRRAYDVFKADAPRLRSSFFDDWSKVGERELGILDNQREALALWLEGTKRDRAILVQPMDLNAETIIDVNQRLRNFSDMANLQAFRLQHEGDLAGAWTWLRANLRAGRHSGMNGCIVERLIGINVYSSASNQAMHWADDPRVDARLLRRALDEVLAIDALTAPYRETLRTEFFGAMNTYGDPAMRERIVTEEKRAGKELSGTFRDRLEAQIAMLSHEPERSRRVTRLVLSNWLAACDLPPAEREAREVKFAKLTLFRPGPGEGAPLSPEAIAGWTGSTRYAKIHLNVWSAIANMMTRDERARATILVHLAEELYKREHGEDPPSIEALVGPYLPAIPAGYLPQDDRPENQGPKR
jgi:hypothetical protein